MWSCLGAVIWRESGIHWRLSHWCGLSTYQRTRPSLPSSRLQTGEGTVVPQVIAVCSGCCGKVRQLGDLQTRISFSCLWRLEARDQPAPSGPSEGPAPLNSMASQGGESAGELSGIPFIRALIPLTRTFQRPTAYHRHTGGQDSNI